MNQRDVRSPASVTLTSRRSAALDGRLPAASEGVEAVARKLIEGESSGPNIALCTLTRRDDLAN